MRRSFPHASWRQLGRVALVLVLAVPVATARGRAEGDPAGRGGEAPQAPPAADPRHLVLLKVKNAFKPEDKIFGQVVEGRLISDLADMETFRMTGQAEAPDYTLLATIRNLVLTTGITYEPSRDADASEQTKEKDMVSVTMDMDLLVQDRQSKQIYAGKLSVGATRELEISLERTNELLTQELVDRAAQKVERTLRKKLPKVKS